MNHSFFSAAYQKDMLRQIKKVFSTVQQTEQHKLARKKFERFRNHFSNLVMVLILVQTLGMYYSGDSPL